MFIVVGIIVVIFVVFGTVILAQNAIPVTLTLLGKTIHDISLSLVIIESVVIGIVFAFIIMAISEIKLRRLIRNKERDVKNLKEELAAIRNLPLKEEKVEKEE